MTPHEYVVVGHSRAAIGRHLGTAAGLIAAAGAALLGFTLQLAKSVGLSQHVPEYVLWPVTAGALYPLFHWIFNTWGWRLNWVIKAIGVPNLSGRWACEGQTRDARGNTTHRWNGTVTIAQTWEKIHICLETGQSRSHSVSASLLKNEGRGFTLMYSYRNEPRIGEAELAPHVGYAEIEFDLGLQRGEGDYFNNKGRVTFGRMALTPLGA